MGIGRSSTIVAFVVASGLSVAAQTPQQSSKIAPAIAPGTVQVEPFDIPFSSFASPQARQKFVEHIHAENPPLAGGIAVARDFYGRFNDMEAARMKTLYSVRIEARTIAGVRTEVITPEDGIAAENRKRVLINLHGGAFMWGDGSGGEVEAIPIASVGKIKVITVFYRLAPENTFPAASIDVAAVYKNLLKTYKPSNIGIYGCSAGGILTAESIAWFDKVNLPLPGAIGTFCGSIAPPDGDSAYVAPVLNGAKGQATPIAIADLPYFHGTGALDPLAFPISSPSLLARFPPTLLISGTRDFSLSSLLEAQAALTNANVEVDLHVWDGMWHAFFVDPDLPESREAYAVIVRFFARHLGAK